MPRPTPPEIQVVQDRYGDLARVDVESYILFQLGELTGAYRQRADDLCDAYQHYWPDYSFDESVNQMLEPITPGMIQHLREQWQKHRTAHPESTPFEFAHNYAQDFVDMQETPLQLGPAKSLPQD